MSESGVHVALFPGTGMGHLTPFLRLASVLLHNNLRVTLITTHPTVSLAESTLLTRFHSSHFHHHHHLTLLDFNLLPLDPSAVNSTTDPFWLRLESIRRSSHLLSPLLLSLENPLSAFVLDMTLISPVLPLTQSLSLPTFILFTSSLRMFSFFSHFSTASLAGGEVKIPGIPAIPKSSICPPLLDPNSLFGKIMFQDSANVTKIDGVIVNSFENLEQDTLDAINAGKILNGSLPPVFAVGPFLPPCEFEKLDDKNSENSPLKWLDLQPEDSVVYVSFGSRTAMKRDQIREIGDGLLRSECRFLWVVKDKLVDREEEVEVEEVVGREIIERLKNRGIVVKTWVDQREILKHPSVGGFVSHCGWNSLVEAASFGVRIMGWPLHGDQKINAEVVEKCGLGVWEKKWGWGEEVKGEEIGKRIKEMMSDECLKETARRIGDAARKAVADGGSSDAALRRLIGEWKKKMVMKKTDCA